MPLENSTKYSLIQIFKEDGTITTTLFNGMEGVFFPVMNPKLSAKWYEETLGFKLMFI